MLTSAIVVAIIHKVFDLNSTILLAAQYALWAVFLLALKAKLPSSVSAKGRQSSINAWMIWFLVALLATTISVWFRELRTDITWLFVQTAALGYMTVVFFAMQLVARSADTRAAVVLMCHVILALCLYSIASDLTGITHYEQGEGRFFGSLGDQAAWALTLPLIVYFSSGRLILAATAGFALVLTGSRAPALVVLAGFLLLMLFGQGRRSQNALTLSILALLSILQANLFTTLAGRLGATKFTSNDRLVTARLGIRDFRDSPFTGYGYNSLAYLHRATVRMVRLGMLPTQSSTFVQMLSDGGIFLFLTYFMFVATVTLAGLSLLRRATVMRDGGTTYGLVSWLLAMLWLNQSASWFVIGSYIGPLVLGMAGILSGYWTRLRFSLPSNGSTSVATSQRPLEQ